MVLRFCELLRETCRLNPGLDGALELLPFPFCFDLPFMFSIAPDHVLLSLLDHFRVEVVKDSLVPSELVFMLNLIMSFYPLKEQLFILQLLTLAHDVLFKSYLSFPLQEVIILILDYL